MHLQDQQLLAVWDGMHQGFCKHGVGFFRQMHQYGVDTIDLNEKHQDEGFVFSRQLMREANKETRVRQLTVAMAVAYVGDGLLSIPSMQAIVVKKDHVVACFDPLSCKDAEQMRTLTTLGGKYHEGLDHVRLSSKEQHAVLSLVELFNDFSKETIDLEQHERYTSMFDTTFVQGKPKSYLAFLRKKDYLVEQLFPFAERQLYLNPTPANPSQGLKKM